MDTHDLDANVLPTPLHAWSGIDVCCLGPVLAASKVDGDMPVIRNDLQSPIDHLPSGWMKLASTYLLKFYTIKGFAAVTAYQIRLCSASWEASTYFT